MELRPQDLDAAHREKLLRLREGAAQQRAPELPAFLKKDSQRRDNRPFRIFAAIFLAFFLIDNGMILGNFNHVGLHFSHWSWIFLFGIPFWRKKVKNKFQESGYVQTRVDDKAPITLMEADALGSGAKDLEVAYSMLLRSVIEAQGLSPSAQRNVHEALIDIGDLVTKLSVSPAPSMTGDPANIQRQADETEERARHESDAVVAASLRRQADTLRGSAVLAGQRSTLRRRREAAQGEVLTQIQAMQVSLESHALSGQNESGDFEGLSTNIQQIAAEVNSTLNARDEVRSVIDPSYQEPPVNTQRLGQ
ncbi:MAG: hypothetical protein ABIY70_14930 [Capsulimonas sp.]|uniref:hypothetical protein n=1 Tax=Capsulimonas sp. TaxID=2494211 RepID=UPI0032669594